MLDGVIMELVSNGNILLRDGKVLGRKMLLAGNTPSEGKFI